jgi:hypothetical protein
VAEDAALRDEIRRLEEHLLDPRVRASRGEIEALLGEEFVEIGSSGRVFDRDAVIAALVDESGVAFALSDFRATRVAADVVFATYRATARVAPSGTARHSLRSSLWVRRAERWRMVFHQGTPTSVKARPKEQT